MYSKHLIPLKQYSNMSSRRDNLKRKATAAAEVKAKRAKGETDLGDNLKWEHVGEIVKSVCPLIVLSSSSLAGRQKVAGFDIDFTVIKTASGRRFATGIQYAFIIIHISSDPTIWVQDIRSKK